MKRNLKGSAILLLAAVIWGMSFAAQSSAADSVPAFTFTAVRSWVGTAFLGLVLAVRRWSGAVPAENTQPGGRKKAILGGLVCGLALFAASNFQQGGISCYPPQAAASGRAGFLTATYVVMVAIVSALTGKKLHPVVCLSAVGCIAGMYLLCMANGFAGIYFGDVLELLCAVGYTVHILITARYAKLDCILVSCVQFGTVALLSTASSLLFETCTVSAILGAWVAILYTGVLSSGVAFTLQIVGQKYADPTVASIVMSLESVFAGLAGWLILGERLSGRELLGCALVFAAVILAQVPGFFKKKQETRQT